VTVVVLGGPRGSADAVTAGLDIVFVPRSASGAVDAAAAAAAAVASGTTDGA